MKRYLLFIIFSSILLLFSCTRREQNQLVYPELDPLKIEYPELYKELLLLPDLQKASISTGKALEQIVQLARNPEYKNIFEKMINEGIKESRKYCTPLEALLWLAYDKDFSQFDPLENYNLERLLISAWTETSISSGFTSEPWQNFKAVTNRLNSPNIISIYMLWNFTYSYKKMELEGFRSARRIYFNRTGPCYDQALLVSYLLKKNGYDTEVIAISFDREIKGLGGHVAMTYRDPIDSQYYAIDSNYLGPQGPFSSIQMVPEYMCYGATRGAAELKEYKSYNISLLTGRYIKIRPYF